MHSLSGKLALVTGGTGGIGRAVAKNFVESGATVVITGRRNSGNEIAREIGAEFIHCDASDEARVSECFSTTEKARGKIDILVANAGMADDEGSIEKYESERMRRLLDTNVTGTFLALKHAPQHMKDGGSIITTGSSAGSGITNAGAGVYAASKAGVAYLTRTCAIELAPREIRANVVCPALISDTGMMTIDDGGPEATFLATLTAFGRMGRLDEVVGIYNFLASPASSFITGQEIRVDGGMTAGIGLPMMAAISKSVSPAGSG